MAGTYLVIAGLLEIVWAIGLKYTEGFSRLWPSVTTIGTIIASFALLAQALKSFPLAPAMPFGPASVQRARLLSGWHSSASHAKHYE